MKFVIISLIAAVLLSGCGQAHFSPAKVDRLLLPDVVEYPKPVQLKAAQEIETKACPVLGDIMMPDYGVIRDQTRVAKKALK